MSNPTSGSSSTNDSKEGKETNMKKLLGFCALALVCGGCEQYNSSDNRELVDIERQQEIYTKNQPPPFFEWSFERHLMTKLYEARNNAVTTYSYLQSPYTGKIMSECTSLGYPIPATTQLTNPQKLSLIELRNGYAQAILPQAEPNGMYTPSSTSATWVMCLGPDGRVEPAYWEGNVSTYPRPMEEVNGKLVAVDGGASSISIDPKRPEK